MWKAATLTARHWNPNHTPLCSRGGLEHLQVCRCVLFKVAAKSFSRRLLSQVMSDTEDSRSTDCAICWSPYNNTFQTPKLLDCQHSFCLECLARMRLAMNPGTPGGWVGGLPCPLCRHITPLEVGQSVTELPTDLALLELMRLKATPMVLEDGRLYYEATSRKPWFRKQRPTIYTLSLDMERRLRLTHNQVHPGPLDAENSPNEGCFSPQLRTFSYVMLAIFVVTVLLIMSLYWTRQVLWGNK
ncbi:E3 ubiquitin-protein ligase RNF183-like [Polypterus senegalus]|uniref:E3 ubiquitin-protein ligase RNF183-like n=1 Tax=Polypterus senegalus TaxID=55291 RepID=UPI00196490BC|nr:E3 ubiquitin-protein ligase RNF183-like [Polypterus senegalus]